MQIDATTLLTFWSIPSAATGLCFWVLQKNMTKRDTKREELDKARKKNEILLIHSVGAAIALGEATAHAIRDGKCNGEMSAALEYAQKVKHEQKDFMTEQGIGNLY
ncbi:serine/threonine protein kinase [Desulfosporosinus sp. SB140]|uniref:serine/threonine protein kinase n=1 Tax=Desulfosporosinus paludis TaxID=3115649 RepID=UPI00388F0355